MGGKKKLGIKQMEKQQDSKASEDKSKDAKKTEKKGLVTKKTVIGILSPDVKDDKIVAEVKKMNVLTPYAVATRYGVRLSAAKDFLEQLDSIGAIQLVSASHNLKIYKPAA